jgi:hypothetical protein
LQEWGLVGGSRSWKDIHLVSNFLTAVKRAVLLHHTLLTMLLSLHRARNIRPGLMEWIKTSACLALSSNPSTTKQTKKTNGVK